jgi:hypothetical protein
MRNNVNSITKIKINSRVDRVNKLKVYTRVKEGGQICNSGFRFDKTML